MGYHVMFSFHPQLEMAALGSLTGPAGLVTPSFPGTGLGSQPTPSSPGGKTGLPGSATGLSGFSQIPGQQHVRKLTMSSWHDFYIIHMHMHTFCV